LTMLVPLMNATFIAANIAASPAKNKRFLVASVRTVSHAGRRD
jgi:hypothetical protein